MQTTNKRSLNSLLAGVVLTVVSSHAATSFAQVAQEPLFLGGKATPNMLYNIDESWSMAWRYMPDELILSDGTIYGNPWATGAGDRGDGSGNRWGVAFHPGDVSTGGATEGSNKNTFVARADGNGIATDLLSSRLRSPAFNTIYYNPEVRYEPWYKADGSRYPEYDAAVAPLHPLAPTRTVNLKGEITYANPTRWCGSFGNDAGANSTAVATSTTVNCRDLSGEKLAPAVWYKYLGNVDEAGRPVSKAALETVSNFERVRIMDHATFVRGNSRQDCAAIASGAGNTCTQQEEYQNFANWFTYSRSRMFLAITATTKAFADFDGGLRLGYGRMHKSGVIEQGVRPFDAALKQEFFTWLNKMAGTLGDSALYGSGSSTNGHFFAGGTYLRRATEEAGRYFLTDEPYRIEPSDTGSTLLGCRKNYHLLMTDGSEADSGWNNYSNRVSSRDTLPAIARYYYETDLRPNLANNVPPDPLNTNNKQHMVNFMVGLGLDVPDMSEAATISKGNYFSASNVQEFAKSLSDTLTAVIVREGSSAASIAANSTRLDSGTLIYQASFDSKDWSGRLRAYRPDPITGQVDEASPVWDTNTKLVRASQRNIFTPAGVTSSGQTLTTQTPFLWDNLSSEQKLLLQAGGTATQGESRLSWIRGSAAQEGTESGKLRKRTKILGDIVNSDPAFVGQQDFGYAQFTSGLTSTEITAYETFLANTVSAGGKKGRRDMLYVGANDGMLHGFDANTGVEAFAFVPAGVFPKLNELTSQTYSHKYFVDGSPRVVDAYLTVGGVAAWRSVLVGATGAGGKSVFALDVTNPNNPKLLWEYSGTASEEMGLSMSAPSVVRLANGKWVAIFGNGYDKTTGNVKLMVRNLATGAHEGAIDTGVAAAAVTTGGPVNALASVAPVDIDGDRITDYAYAGDLAGNLWRFDLTGNGNSQWVAKKLFTATDGTNLQPITTRPEIGRHPDGGVLVYFGTGKYFETADRNIPSSPPVQTFYAIRDQNFNVNGNSFSSVTRSQLQQQTLVFEGTVSTSSGPSLPFRVASSNVPGTAPAHGWYMNLRSPANGAEGERAVSMPILRFGRVIFTTIIPDPNQCGQGGRSWLMELDALNGGRLSYSVFDTNDDMLIDDNDFINITIGDEVVRVPVSGQGTDEMIKTPGIVSAGDLEYKYTSGSSGSIGVIREQGAGEILGRQSWRQIQ